MASEWPLAKIEDIAERVAMGPFGSSIKVSTFVETGIPVISGQHLHGFRLTDGGNNFITETHADILKNANVCRGDVIFTHAGNIGQVAFIPETSKYDRYVISQRQFFLRCDVSKLIPEFVTYYFRSREGQHKLLANASSVGVPSIARPVSYLRSIEIPLPSLPEQKRIANILGTLDDKIENNRRMNATLEAMACTLFQSWFVDFTPVHAKAQGRRPAHMDAATAALFPKSFQDSELGPIPKGWEVRTVGEVVECVGGTTPSTSEPKYWDNGIHHWATPKDFSSLQSPILTTTDRQITDEGVAKISSGLLPEGTLLLSSRAPVGYLAIAAMPVAINQGFIAMKCNEHTSNYFMLNWCRQNMSEIEGRATGTTFAEISKQNFRPIPIVFPPLQIMKDFTKKVDSLYLKMKSNIYQSHALATLRDTLLPKLMRG